MSTETVARTIEVSIAPYCTTPEIATDIANNAAQVLCATDDYTYDGAWGALADCMYRRLPHVRHIVRASELGARAYFVALRPTTTMRYELLTHYGVIDPHAWLVQHGLLQRYSL